MIKDSLKEQDQLFQEEPDKYRYPAVGNVVSPSSLDKI
jgi:hypothetical protein